MKILTVIARIALGVVFVVFGLNTFLHIIPAPPMTGDAAQFIGLLMSTGYMKVVAVCQVAGGFLLLTGSYVPLALTLLGPVIVNILCFHLFIDRKGLPLALVVAVLALFLLWRYWKNFASLLRP